MTETDQFGRKQPKATWPILLVACPVAAIWTLVYSALQGPPRQVTEVAPQVWGIYATGYLIGTAVFVTLVTWVGVYFLFLRKRAPERGPRYLAIILSSAVLGVAPLIYLAFQRASFAEVQAIDERYGIALQSLEDTHNAALREILVPHDETSFIAGLQGREDLPELRGRLQAARQTVEESRQARLGLQARALDEIRALGRADEADILERAAAAHGEVNQIMDRTVDLNLELIAAISSQLDVLDNSQGRWRAVNNAGSLEFESQADLDAYNRAVAETAAVLQRIEAHDAEIRAHQQRHDSMPEPRTEPPTS